MSVISVNNIFDRDNLWEKPPCPICGKTSGLKHTLDVNFWEYPGTYKISICKKCKIYLQTPRVKKRYVDIYYQDQEYWRCDLSKLKIEKMHKIIGRNRYKQILKIANIKNPGRVLDVGCGSGILLSEFKDEGWEVKGIDISKSASDYANKMFGIDVEVADINDYKENKKYDLVTITHVLEHVYNPVKALKKANQLLEKDGKLILIVPNIESIGFKIFKNKWLHFYPGRHLYYYSPQTITKLLEKSGFSVLNIIHDNWDDNYYSHFQTIRFRFSPKFVSGEKSFGYDPRKPLKRTTVYDLKKVLASIFAGFLTVASAWVGYSDVITVYAKKKN